MKEKKLCKGKTKRGKPCSLPPQQGKDYCHYHLPENEKIESFFESHKEEILSFFAGTIADPISSDLYEFMKEQLGFNHLIPPVKSTIPDITRIRSHFIKHRDHESLIELVPLLRLGMAMGEVHDLLGPPQGRYYQNSLANIKNEYDGSSYASHNEEYFLLLNFDKSNINKRILKQYLFSGPSDNYHIISMAQYEFWFRNPMWGRK